MSEYVLYKNKKYRVRKRPSLVEGVPPLIEGDLILRGLGIRDISEVKGLEYLTSVKKLDLSKNQIKEIEGLENLTELKKLNLSSNQINEIKGLKSLENLTHLNLSKNQITKINGLQLLTNLERLSLSENKINEIGELETLTVLGKLDLENNQITEIKGLDNLKNLGVLDLRTNQIKEIKGLENLTELKNLFLQNNQITELKGLENLKWLSLLDIKNNEIREIKGIENLKNLFHLELKGNNIPEPIGTTTIKDFEILNVLAHLWERDFILDINFKVNEFIVLKLEDKPKSSIPKKETFIYVKGQRFDQCKFLLIPILANEVKNFKEIDSIDEAAEEMDRSLEYTDRRDVRIPVMTEFWGHCSNMQTWAEHNYDTRLLHRNLAFPLLKRLTEVGDPIAKKVFREEIAKRYTSGHPSVVEYLKDEGYLKHLSKEELEFLL